MTMGSGGGPQQGHMGGSPPPAGGAPPGGLPPAGAPPGGPMAAAVPAAGAATRRKSGGPGIGLVVGIVLGVLVIGAAVFGFYMLLAGGGAKLAGSVPADVEVFIEVPSVAGALKSGLDMGVVNADKLDADKWIKETEEGLEDAFDLEKDDAKAIVESISGVALAVRNPTKKEQAAVLISFSSNDGIEALLKSKRFSQEGSLGGGKRYVLESVDIGDVELEELEKWSLPRKSLAFMSYSKDSKRSRLVWFEDAGLLVAGSKRMIEDIGSVIAGDSESLADSDKWGKAELDSGADAIAFVDSGLLRLVNDDEGEEIVKGYFDDVGPLGASLTFVKAGILISARGEMKGSKLKEDDALPSAASLDLQDKLPAETIGYIALSTKRDEDGEALKKRLVNKLRSVDDDMGGEVEKSIDQMKEVLGIGLDDILDAVGDQMVIAFAADKELVFDEDKDPKDYVEQTGAAYLLSVSKKEDAVEVVKVVREKLFGEGPMGKKYEVAKRGDGFDATPKEGGEGLPEIKVRLSDDHLLVAAGGLADRFIDALAGDNTLGDDAGHKAARGAISGKPRMLLWVDTGRIGQVARDWVDGQDDVKKTLEEVGEQLGVSSKALKLKGDERMTSLVALSVESSDDTWKLHLETLNASALGIFANAAAMFRSLRPPREKTFFANTGLSTCDGLVMSMQTCARKTGDDEMMAAARLDHQAYKDTAQENPGKKKKLEQVCTTRLLDFFKDNPQCK